MTDVVGQALAGRTSQYVKGPKKEIDLDNNAVSESTEMQMVDAITESNQLAESGRSGKPDFVIDDVSDASSMMDVQNVERFSTASISDAGSTLIVQKLGISKKASTIDDSMANISMATIEEDADGNQEMEVE